MRRGNKYKEGVVSEDRRKGQQLMGMFIFIYTIVFHIPM